MFQKYTGTLKIDVKETKSLTFCPVYFLFSNIVVQTFLLFDLYLFQIQNIEVKVILVIKYFRNQLCVHVEF